jgi:hypothetical protein
MIDLNSTSFPVHPTTYGAPNHSEGMRVNLLISTTHVGTQGLALGED